MKANELRIGNLVYPLSGGQIRIPISIPHMVLEIGLFEIKYLREELIPAQEEQWPSAHLKDITGIPINEDWLHKLEFKNTSIRWNDSTITPSVWMKENKYCVEFTPDGVNFFLFFGQKGNPVFIDYVPYVHQLQNLFFALTGSELTIKETA